MNKKYSITFSINRPHLLFACVTLYSLLKNNREYYFDVYILHSNCVSQEEIDDICNKFPLNQFSNFRIYLVDTSKIEVLQGKDNILYEDQEKIITLCSKEILFKLLLSELLPNIDKILHLDTDVMIRGDIKSLFDIEDNYLFKGYSTGDGYWINAGVMLINLKLGRELRITEKIVSHLKEHSNTEEYIINNLFKDKRSYYDDNIVLHLQSNNRKAEYKLIIAVHFLTNKPFDLSSVIPNKVLYMEYHSYLKDFMKSKIRFRLLIINSFIFTTFLSYRRRIIKFIKKCFKIKSKGFRNMSNNNTYMKSKIYKYAIIKKQ